MARTCFYAPVDQYDANGYIPSLVTEGEAGHAPLTGNGPFATPWYWGKTHAEALATCAAENTRMGLSSDDVLDIMTSSMTAGRR